MYGRSELLTTKSIQHRIGTRNRAQLTTLKSAICPIMSGWWAIGGAMRGRRQRCSVTLKNVVLLSKS